MTLEQIQLAAYESIAPRMQNLTLDDFVKATEEFEFYPVLVKGKLVGAIVIHGPEIHACIKPEGFKRWFNKSAAKALNDVISKHGEAITRVAHGNEIGMKFVERLGFVFLREEGDSFIYVRGTKWA